jgi:hypothetical protein
MYRRYPGVMTSWDNTARRGKAGNVFAYSSPRLYGLWLRQAIKFVREKFEPDERLVFINAWNEWAEGAHLEPDHMNGRGYLEETRDAINPQDAIVHKTWREMIDSFENMSEITHEFKEIFASTCRSHFEGLERSLNYFRAVSNPFPPPNGVVEFKEQIPILLGRLRFKSNGFGHIDKFCQYDYLDGTKINKNESILIRGWSFCATNDPIQKVPSYFMLSSLDKKKFYYALIIGRFLRKDVSEKYKKFPPHSTLESGIHFCAQLNNIEPGQYSLSIVHVVENYCNKLDFKGSFEVY